MEITKQTRLNNLRLAKKVCMDPKKFKKTEYTNKACFSTDNYSKYGCFESWETAINILNNLPQNENNYNELLLPGNKVKPYLDIEYLKNENPDLHPNDVKIEVMERLINIFKDEFKYKLRKSDIYFSECHRKKKEDYKYSFHVVISTKPTIVFETTNKASFVAHKLRENFRYNENIIDVGVYKKVQNFRLVGHCKPGENIPFRQCDNGDENIGETIVSNVDTHSIILEAPEQQDLLVHKLKNKGNYDLENISDENYNLIIQKVQNELHETSFLEKIDANGFLQFNYTDRTEPCFIHKNVNVFHEQLGFFVYIYNNLLYAGCHSGNCSKENNKKQIIQIGKIEEKEKDYNFFEKVDYNNQFNFDPVFVFRCVKDEAYGISNLFEKMYLQPQRIKWVNDKKNGTTYFWDGNIWTEDDFSYVSRLLTATVVNLLRKTISSIYENEDIITINGEQEENNSVTDDVLLTEKMIVNLNSGRIINNVLKFFQPLTRDTQFLSIKDQHPHFLSCKNGMVNLYTGELRNAVPADNITKTINLEYNQDITNEDFDNFVREITSSIEGEREEVYNYLRWLIGYAVQGDPCKKMFIILHGNHGFNGKSLLMNTISNILDYYSSPMDESVVLESGKKTGGSHSTEIVQLEYARLSILSDVSEGASLDDGMVKKLTGITDILSVREIYGKQREFIPKMVPFINSNHPIAMNLTDKALFERLLVIFFELSFVDDPKKPYERKNDQNLNNKFNKNKQGILTWIVECSIYYNKNREMPIPEELIKAKDEYNKLVNPYINFISTKLCECSVEQKEAGLDKIPKSVFLGYYKDYCKENNIKYTSRIAEKEFDKIVTFTKINQQKYYLGFYYIKEDNTINNIDELDI